MLITAWIFGFSLILRYRRSHAHKLRCLLDELFAAGIVSSALSLLPWILFQCAAITYFAFLAIDDGLYQSTRLRFRWELSSHFRHPSLYWTSIWSLRKKWIFSLCYWFIQSTAIIWASPQTSWTLNGCLLACGLFTSAKKEHLLWVLVLPLLQRKTKTKASVSMRQLPIHSTEKSQFLSANYPLLRTTHFFHGPQHFAVSSGSARPHLIFCFLESFRAKNVGCLQAQEAVTPCFDQWSQKGVLFSRFYSNSNSTSWATIASLFGIPSAGIPSYQNFYVDLPLIGLPKILKKAGYHPAVIQGSHLLLDHTDAFYRFHGFETIIGKKEIEKKHPLLPSTSWGIHDEGLFRYAVEWLKQQTSPVFLNLFSITNHHPWICPPSWKCQHQHPFLNTMAYTDWALGQFIQFLQKAQLWDQSILFVMGDHGQVLGEHNRNIETHRMLYEEDVRVPLLILAPGRLQQPCIVQEPCSQIDLLPTVLDILNLSSTHHSCGTSLVRKKKRMIFLTYPFEEKILGCRVGEWKYLLNGEKEELFDLQSDPNELHNLASTRPFRKNTLKKMTLRYADALHSLYENRSFAPPSDLSCPLHFSPSKDIRDPDLLRELAKNTSLISLDLSECQQLRAPFIDKPKHLLRHLNVSKCLWVRDGSIAQIRRAFPHLVSLNLSQCPLLSDAGIQTLLFQSELEELDLSFLEDLRSVPLRSSVPHIRKLNILGCPQLDSAGWAKWISDRLTLNELRLCCTHWTDADLKILSQNLSMLGSLFLSEGFHLSSTAIQELVQANPSLLELSLDRCPHANDDLLRSLRKWRLGYLTLSENTQITDTGLDACIDMPLQWLKIRNCPGIRVDGLIRQVRDRLAIFVEASPFLSSEDIEQLRSNGIHVWP